MSKFYARFKESQSEIAIFNNKQERDDWVNFRDEFSLAFGNSAEDATFGRVALTNEETKNIVGNQLNNIKNYIRDEILQNVHWILVN